MTSKCVQFRLLLIYNHLLEHYGPQHWWPGDSPFEVIVGAILTQSAAWINVEKGIKNLKASGLLSPAGLRGLAESDIARLIYSCGYYNAKAAKLKAFAQWVGDNYGDDLKAMFSRDTTVLREELLVVYGIGKETADSILLYAGDKPIFVIDAYTRRIMHRQGFKVEGEDYDSYQNLFMSNLPADASLFNEYHALLVRLGKDVCHRNQPECPGCCLSDICPTQLYNIHNEGRSYLMSLESSNRSRVSLPIVIALTLVAALFLGTTIYEYNAWNKTNHLLVLTRSEFDSVQRGMQTQIDANSQRMQTLQSELASVRNTLNATNASFIQAQTELGETKSELEAKQQEMSALQTNYERLITGYGYVFNDPTYRQMKDFLATDTTDANEYDLKTYNCTDYSSSVIDAAAKQKTRCAYVSIDYPDSAHAIVAFNTTDRGIVYIEPQSDDEVLLEVGKHYYQSVIPTSDYYYLPPIYDDTVVRFNIIW